MLPTAAELRRLLDGLPELICQIDASGRYLFANRAYVARFDRSPESVIGIHLFSDVIGPAAYETIAPLVTRVLAGETGESAIEVPYPTGRRLMRCADQQKFHDRRRVTSFVVALTDETARLNAEEALRLSREHLDFIVESTDIGVWSCDLPFDVLPWNARCKEHFGLSPDALVTIDTFYDRMHPDDVERTRLAIDQAIASRVSYDTEYRTLRAGRRLPVDSRDRSRRVHARRHAGALRRRHDRHRRAEGSRTPAARARSPLPRDGGQRAGDVVGDGRGGPLRLSEQGWYDSPAARRSRSWGRRLKNIHPDDFQQARNIFLGATSGTSRSPRLPPAQQQRRVSLGGRCRAAAPRRGRRIRASSAR